VLLLDEPNAGLDLRHQIETLELARELARRGCAVLAVLHDLALATRFADEVLVMRDGCAVAAGTPRAALTPAIVGDVFGVELSWLRHDDDPSAAMLPMVTLGRRQAPPP
jgi:iron complex transport system ATP-binding protein